MRFVICIGMFVLLSCVSCGKRTIKVDRVMQKIIDTTAAPKMVLLREELDSMCELRTDSLVAAAVDSILSVRRTEIDKIGNDAR